MIFLVLKFSAWILGATEITGKRLYDLPNYALVWHRAGFNWIELPETKHFLRAFSITPGSVPELGYHIWIIWLFNQVKSLRWWSWKSYWHLCCWISTLNRLKRGKNWDQTQEWYYNWRMASWSSLFLEINVQLTTMIDTYQKFEIMTTKVIMIDIFKMLRRLNLAYYWCLKAES